MTSPAFVSTMSTRLMPNPFSNSVVCLVGLISPPKEDLIALAASAAGIPPSLIATIMLARSPILPPKPCTTGPALIIPTTKSSSVVDVWFSTAFNRLIDSVNSVESCLNTLWIASVAFIASCLSTSPRTDKRMASLVDESKSSFVLPVAAMSAAIPRVSVVAIPIVLEISVARAKVFVLI